MVHPELVSVNVKMAEPAARPVAVFPDTPTIEGDPLVQVPPVEGDNVEVAPIQILSELADTVGGGLITNADVVLVHPVVEFVNVKVADP